MRDINRIPSFALFGETGDFPDVIHCERIVDRARKLDWRISPHRHTQMAQVFYLERGRAEVVVDGVNSTMRNGDLLYMPSNAVHGFAFARGTEGLVLSFPVGVQASILPKSVAFDVALSKPFSGTSTPALEALFRALAHTFSSRGTYRAQALVGLAHAVLAEIASQSPSDATGHADSAQHHMHSLEGLLAEHLGDGWSAGEYASALSITTGHLNRICHASRGMSLSQFIEATVMTEAARLLAFTRLPVAEVGYRLGYTDPPYFSRRFRAVRGETPSAYRAKFLDLT